MMTLGRGQLADALGAAFDPAPPGRVTRDASIAELTTYRLGGPVAVLARVGSAGELGRVSDVVRALDPPLLVLGRGSNLLVCDSGFAGLAIVLDGEYERIEIGATTVHAGGAVPLPVLARRAAAAGRAGLEFFVGIPGTVGGAVRMNAGGHGRDVRETLRRAWIADLSTPEPPALRAAGELSLGYRRSALGAHEVVIAAEFATATDDVAACEARIADVVRWRREHQPGGANAGSVFANPPGDSAGRLIDSCGLKGHRIGGAMVSPKHANFIQAEPDATAADVHTLVVEIRRRVESETGVRLEPELHLVGFEEEEVP